MHENDSDFSDDSFSSDLSDSDIEERGEKLKALCNEHTSVLGEEISINRAYTWTIYNLDYLFKMKRSKSIASPKSVSTDDFDWNIKLNLFDKHTDYVTLSIDPYTCDDDYSNEPVAKCAMSIINKDGAKVNTRVREFTWKEERCVFKDFIKRDDLYNEADGYVYNNKLTLHCRMTIKFYCERFDDDERMSQNKLQVSRDLKSLLASNDFSDITFYVQEKEFSAHKAILASRSPIFVAMFENEMLEKVENKVHITDISSENFEKLLQFVYSGTLEDIDKLSKNDLTQLLNAAEKYQLKDLKELCAVVFFNTLSTSNAVELLITADTYNIDSLKEQTIEYLLAHKKDIICSAEYASFTISHPHLLAKIIDICKEHSNKLENNNLFNSSPTPVMSIPIVENCWGVTQATVRECFYTWEINNIESVLSRNGKTDYVSSNKFFFDNDIRNKIVWQLILYPNGVNQKANGYLSLFLKCLFKPKNNKTEKVRAQYNFQIIDKTGNVIKSVKSNMVNFRIESNQDSSQGEAKLLERKCFYEDQFKESINDTLTIKCTLTYSFGNYDSIRQIWAMDHSTTRYLLNISKDLENFFTSATFSDMTIQCTNRKFKLHRLILSIRCPLLLSMLNQLSKNETDDCIDIGDLTEPNVFEELLRYVYSGNVNNMQNLAKDLYCEANKYQLEDLKNLCEMHLCNNITVENVCDYLVFAHINMAYKLKNATTQCIVDNISKISSTSGYISLSSSRPNLLKDIILKLKMIDNED